MRARIPAAAAMVLMGGLGGMVVDARGDENVTGTSDLTVEMTGFRNDRGNAKIALWRSKDGFPADESKAERRYQAPIVGGKATLLVERLEPGDWAIAAFHDENDNGKIDLGLFGIPKEGLGVSRDAKGMLGPPSFKSAKLVIAPGERRVGFRIFYY
ncbi:MAG: DUF2141 domain-containing protein [Deltaproteobacteria bacterium]|nr:DUF2141 domain-containing protein [Deltaproteobacteria bacterium]